MNIGDVVVARKDKDKAPFLGEVMDVTDGVVKVQSLDTGAYHLIEDKGHLIRKAFPDDVLYFTGEGRMKKSKPKLRLEG